MNRPRVLLIAEACNPEWVSVPLEGWSHCKAIRNVADAHIVTQVRNRDAIVRAGWIEGQDFTAINSENVERWTYRIAKLLRGGESKAWTLATAMQSLTYPYFEHLVWKQFGQRIAAGEFDIVHRITPLTPTSASPIARKCRKHNVPFIMGPLNGGLPWPKGFSDTMRQEKEWLSKVRSLHKLLPEYRATRTNAAAILCGSRDTWKQMPARFHDKCFYVPENAIDPARFTLTRTRVATSPIRAAFVGRLVPYKGADMLLEAAAPVVKQRLLTLDIIGDGPQMPDLRQLVSHHSIESAVHLHGWMKHDQVQNVLSESDLFAFPSIREFGGAVVLEAMAMGAVPVVVNYGGPGELISPATGFGIEIAEREQIIEQLRQILTDLARDPNQLNEMSSAAMKRARSRFTWEAKAQQVRRVYEWVLARSPRPAWEMPLADNPALSSELLSAS